MIKQPKRSNPLVSAPNKNPAIQDPYKQQQFKPDSPRFGNIPHRQISDPSFNSSLRTANDAKSQNRRKAELVFLRLENQLSKMAFYLGEKQRLLKLSDAFQMIKQRRQKTTPTVQNYTAISIKSKLLGLARVLRNRSRLNIQAALIKIKNSSQRNLIKTNSKYATRTYDHDNVLLTELQRKGEVDYDRRTMKPSKKSTLQSDGSKKLLEAAFKQNQNVDNVTGGLTQLTNLEQENRNLKKEITREEREQTNFVEMMNQLLDQYELGANDESSTSRPNLTSLCSSPEQLKSRSKNSLGDKNKLFKERRY